MAADCARARVVCCTTRRGAGAARRAHRAAGCPRRGRGVRPGAAGDPTVTTILISHRFSTVRHADRICVLEHGRVVELGNHDELMALGGRYKTMFQLQAKRFEATMDEEGVAFDVL